MPDHGRSRGRGHGRGSAREALRGESERGGGYSRGSNPSRGGGGRGRGDVVGRENDYRSRGLGGIRGRGNSSELALRPSPSSEGQGGIYLGGELVPQPDPAITAAEDALVELTRGRKFGDSEFPGRRGYGTKGKPIVLRTNYFKLTKESDITLFRYNVDVVPALSKPKQSRLVEKIMTHPRFKELMWVTDYAQTVVTTKELSLPNGEWKEKIVVPPPQASTEQSSQQGPLPAFVEAAQARNRVEFRITRTGTFSLDDMIKYLQSTSPGTEYGGRDEIIALLNIIMYQPPAGALRVAKVGKNKFYPIEGHPGVIKCELGAGLEALRGFFSSVRPAVGRLLVNLNVASGAFYKPIPLLRLMQEFNGDYPRFERFIRMLKVNAIYTRDGEQNPHMTKVKSIVGFAKNGANYIVQRFGNANEVKFAYTNRTKPTPATKQISVMDYFRNERRITLKYPDLPVLNCGTSADPQYVPMEICIVIPGQSYNHLLDGQQTTAMLGFAARSPNLNAMSIAGTADSPGHGLRLFRLIDPPGDPDPQAKSVQPFGFRVGTEMITVPGRVHASPQIEYGLRKVTPRGGSWNCVDQEFVKPGQHGDWMVLIINHEGVRGNALNPNPQGDMLAPEPLFRRLEKFLEDYGIDMGQRIKTEVLLLEQLKVENRASNNLKLEQAYRRADQAGVRTIFIVLPAADRWLYARIKYYGDVVYGIQTINTVGSKVQKPIGQGMFMANLALKFSVKGGGISHTVVNMLKEPFDKDTMLMGIDVTHPSPGSVKGAPSIAAVVASVDEYLIQWPGSIRTQTGREEMVQSLEEMVLERLDLWQKRQRKYPSKVVLYRDGVSEGQYNLVLQRELPAFHAAFQKRYGPENKWPKMSVIIVGKRHHTRFYPTKLEDADYNPQRQRGSFNPLPGTVVDRHIGGRILHEFWLQAHQGLQGTARPAHYVVIKDDIAFEADELETFTHQLCYLFNRATKAVSICPPAYYADLLCERGRAYLFSTLAEDRSSDGSVYSAAGAEWTSGVHARLKDTTWYI